MASKYVGYVRTRFLHVSVAMFILTAMVGPLDGCGQQTT
jgi:hypothetical protein